MSFILDALKKSETERQKQGAAEFATVPSSRGDPKAPRWLWLLAALLAINLIVLIGLLVRKDAPATVPPDIAEPPTLAQADADTSFADRVAAARSNQPSRQADAVVVAEEEIFEPVAASPKPISDPLTLPTANELRVDGTLQIGELHLDIHVYSDAPTDRFVFINMAKHRENSQLAEGPIVKEITHEGVILSYRGTDFLLPRE